jgi:hypothetical protein
MPDRAFKIGQMVDYRGPSRYTSAAGHYQITRRLPSDEGQYQYRIKSPAETHERVVKESELSDIQRLERIPERHGHRVIAESDRINACRL